MIIKKHSRVMWATTTYGISTITLLWTIFPIYWMIKSSLTVNEEMHVARLPLFSSIVTFDHYIDLIYSTSFIYNVWDSSVIATITTIICLAIGISGPYAMTRLKYPGRSFFRNGIIISCLMPTAMLFVPTYVFVSSLGLYGNKYSLLIIYPTSAMPHCCYMLISYFKATPYALEEAALIGGCNRLQTPWYIIMSIAPPGIAVVATFTFAMTWNEYLYTMIMTTSSTRKAATAAISGFKYADSVVQGKIISASVVRSLPVMLLYIVTQSMLVSGKYGGSVK